jgi:hypothetical protein
MDLTQTRNNSQVNRVVKYLISLTLGIGILIFLVYYFGEQKFFSNLKKVHPIWILIAFIIYSFDFVLRGVRWERILQLNKINIPLSKSVKLTLIGNFANLIIPAKLGDVARIIPLQTENKKSFSNILPTVLLDRFLDFFGVVTLTVVTFYFVCHDTLPQWIYNSIIASIVTTLLCFAFLLFINKKLKLFDSLHLTKFPKFARAVQNIQRSFEYSTDNKSDFFILCFLSLVIWFLEGFIAYVVFIALGYEVNIAVVVFAIMMANLTKTLPVTPSAIGVYEGVMIGIFVLFNLPAHISLSVAVIDHAIKNIYTLLFGALFSWGMSVNMAKLLIGKKEAGL